MYTSAFHRAVGTNSRQRLGFTNMCSAMTIVSAGRTGIAFCSVQMSICMHRIAQHGEYCP